MARLPFGMLNREHHTFMGSVTVENVGIPGVTVTLSGISNATTATDASGQYAFTGLRQGNYSVEISGFDDDAIGFSSTSSAVAVGVGESKIVSFDGTYLRTAGIQGQVSIEGVGLAGVNVSLAGGPDGADMSTTTDAAGLYSFAKLRAGDYAVGISGYDTDDYSFETTSQNVTVALGETATVPFDGVLLRTSGIAGRVSVGGMGIADVTVTVSADGMDDVTAMTDATGQYAVSALAAGEYTVTISGYDAVEYSFEDSQTVTLEKDATSIVNFMGTALRTAGVGGMVTADGDGVAGATVTLTEITGATSGTVLGAKQTDEDGSYSFSPLLAGTYRVDLSGTDDEIDFDAMSWTGQVETGETATVSFDGTINRTGSIGGSVTVDGDGMGGVTVTLAGGDDMVDESMETDDEGSYAFSGLRRGDYTVTVTNPDEARYSFPTTERAVQLAIGQAQSADFAGAVLRQGSISGQVRAGDDPIAGVAVTLSGAASATDTTDANGEYNFNRLADGAYTVTITNPDEAAYTFESLTADVTLADSNSAIQDFLGAHTTTASLSGMLFVDEMDSNNMYDEGEDKLAAANIPLVLAGPSVTDQATTLTDENGGFEFSGLRKGTYQLVVATTGEAAALVPAGYGYSGPEEGFAVMLGVGEAGTRDIPFEITHQTVNFKVELRSGEETGDALEGATVTFYADNKAEFKITDGATGEDGMAAITFARDAATGGNMVYASVMAPDGDDDHYEVTPDPAGMQAVSWENHEKTVDDLERGRHRQPDGRRVVRRRDRSRRTRAAATRSRAGRSASCPATRRSKALPQRWTTTAWFRSCGPSRRTTLPVTYTFALAEDQDDKLDGGETVEAGRSDRVHARRPVAEGHDGPRHARGEVHDPDAEGLRAPREGPGARLHRKRPGRAT